MYREEDLINNQYEVRRCLAGGMGYVYIVFDQVSEKTLAIKTLKDDLVENEEASIRFEREARMWINLGRQENVVHAISFQRGEHPLLILEYIDGPSLRQLIRCEPGGMALCQALSFAIHMADGLAYAHSCSMPGGKLGVIHRDLKPANIMITTDCTARITDFGLARAQDDSELTSSGRAMGSLPYMPPEQWKNAHTVTEKADIYSLGMILYEMVSGARPFPMGTALEIMYQAISVQPEPIETYRSDVDPVLADLIMHCLRKAPDDRPDSAAHLAERFRYIQMRLVPEPRIQPACRGCGYIANKGHMRCPICGKEPESRPSQPCETVRQCRCGGETPAEYPFCTHCGREHDSPEICEVCDTTNPSTYRFCFQCGAPLSDSRFAR